MARKKEFDPLGGSISSEKPKKAKKDNTVLGSKEHAGSSSIYDEVYYMPGSEGSTDALTASGESDKPKKKGLFSGIFGPKPSSKAVRKAKKSGYDAEIPRKEDFRTADTDIHSHKTADLPEEDIFEEEPLKTNEQAALNLQPHNDTSLPHSQISPRDRKPTIKPIEEPPAFFAEEKTQPQKRAVRSHPNVCYLCGADSPTPHRQFGFGGESDPESTVPLCKICMRAVNTLMKYRDPADEQEIKSEWRVLAPGLDEKRADDVIREGRRNFRQ